MVLFVLIITIIVIVIFVIGALSVIGEKERKNKELEERVYLIKSENTRVIEQNEKLNKKLRERLNPDEEEIWKLQAEINRLIIKKNDIVSFIDRNKNNYLDMQEKVVELQRLEHQEKVQLDKIKKTKEVFKAIKNSIDNFHNNTYRISEFFQNNPAISLEPYTEIKLHYMDSKELNKLFKENQKNIQSVVTAYETRYTTKANKSIYHLMVLALQAELQNILYNLKYEKLDKAINDVKEITHNYLKLAEEGNQNIINTIISFIGEIEYLFINAVKIEYNYYVKKEQAKQEQLAIRQQMREEAEERKLLKQQQEKIEAEENKYKQELQRAEELLKESSNNAEIEQLNKRILELQAQLSDVFIKKDEIINLQNGKAGNVYIISNLGSFGDKVFKIGMTRRLDPQDRINELGSASVPFKFDVHSFIFSEDAVDLENKLHQKLNDKRVNKVNMRKEFFNCTIDELEQLVHEIDPTAEFNKTMAAEEYNQSISSNENYLNIYHYENDDELDD